MIDDFFEALLSYKFSELLNRCGGGDIPNPLTCKISIIWCLEDVQAERPDLTDEQASHVLEELKENHDATIGINWDTIQCVANMLYPQNDL